MPDDAIYVYCDLSNGGETCVPPDVHSAHMPNIPWRKEGNSNNWYSNLRGGFKITYETVGVVQMTFLKLLSQDAYQNFTYSCINGVAWYNSKTMNNDLSIKLLGENEQEFSNTAIKPNVLIDGCKTRTTKSETIFEIRTKKLSQLPIVDFYPVDYGSSNQAFGFLVGPVCFK
ncbi:hypothetical protein PPYR_05926 [Photinus pyralis]|uniref:Fibrillar collagen NC1 domain-containing protein n=3 Tax=Photinus pyralis TaxID=7054 RepID=A0A5N4AS98_PHOPY|nr:hypothetical protein PPYR_05926 [Photinus pyralis]